MGTIISTYYQMETQKRSSDLINQEAEKPVIVLNSGNKRKELFQNINERSRLILVSNTKDHIKTLCYGPSLPRAQGVLDCCFLSNPIKLFDHPKCKGFDRELRTRFENTTSFPYSVHGLVRVNIGGNYKSGTGILIGPDLVLTAAHNVANIGEKYSQIQFIPGINDQETPLGIFDVMDSYVPEEYLKTGIQEDYALLVLNGSPGKQMGYFGLHVAEKDTLPITELNLIGYPGSIRTKDENNSLKILSGAGRHQLWGMKGKSWFFEDKGGFIHYSDILTTAGQSGSGVFYHTDSNEYYVIGIHVLGREGEDTYNSATWITRSRFDQIIKWLRQHRANHKKERITKILNLAFKMIGDYGVGFLSKYSLSSLNLKQNNLSHVGIKSFSQANWPNLVELDLSENNIGDEGVNVICTNAWTNLSVLCLQRCHISDRGTRALSQNKSWVNLRSLILRWNHIGDDGAVALSFNRSWVNIITLNLRGNHIGSRGAIALRKNPSWKHILNLNLSDNKHNDEGDLTTLCTRLENPKENRSQGPEFSKVLLDDLSSYNEDNHGEDVALNNNNPMGHLTTLCSTGLESSKVSPDELAEKLREVEFFNVIEPYIKEQSQQVEILDGSIYGNDKKTRSYIKISDENTISVNQNTGVTTETYTELRPKDKRVKKEPQSRLKKVLCIETKRDISSAGLSTSQSLSTKDSLKMSNSPTLAKPKQMFKSEVKKSGYPKPLLKGTMSNPSSNCSLNGLHSKSKIQKILACDKSTDKSLPLSVTTSIISRSRGTNLTATRSCSIEQNRLGCVQGKEMRVSTSRAREHHSKMNQTGAHIESQLFEIAETHQKMTKPAQAINTKTIKTTTNNPKKNEAKLKKSLNTLSSSNLRLQNQKYQEHVFPPKNPKLSIASRTVDLHLEESNPNQTELSKGMTEQGCKKKKMFELMSQLLLDRE